jgi:hypothetical protein
MPKLNLNWISRIYTNPKRFQEAPPQAKSVAPSGCTFAAPSANKSKDKRDSVKGVHTAYEHFLESILHVIEARNATSTGDYIN